MHSLYQPRVAALYCRARFFSSNDEKTHATHRHEGIQMDADSISSTKERETKDESVAGADPSIALMRRHTRREARHPNIRGGQRPSQNKGKEEGDIWRLSAEAHARPTIWSFRRYKGDDWSRRQLGGDL